MKKVILTSFAIALVSLNVFAIPHENCTNVLRARFNINDVRVDAVRKLSLREAINIASSEGYLEGRALRSVQLELDRAKQIYAVYLTMDGGSATEFVTTDRSCTVRRIMRVQED